MESGAADLPLSGITVIDCGQVIAGPTAAMILGDFGAEVIKVENPVGGDQGRWFGRRKDGIPLYWKVLSRNKKSVTLALSKPAGQELFCRLIEQTQADILIESFRPGTLERWGLSPDRLHAVRPGLTVMRVSGFGQFGPYRDRPGFGTLAEAMSGFAHIVGQPDGPPTLPPFPLADNTAALYGVIGALMCLYQRDAKHRGRGQTIDVSLIEPLFTMLSGHVISYDQLGITGTRSGNRTSGSAPRNAYQTKDGRWVAIAGSTQTLAERLFREMGRPDLIEDPRFKSNPDRLANVEVLDDIVAEWVLSLTQEEVVDCLVKAEVAVAPVADFKFLAEDAHLATRGTIATVQDDELGRVRMPSPQPRLSDTPGRIQWAGPPLGSSNQEIYGERLGLSEAEMAELHEQGVI
ncbi:MAG: CoA transferase [Chloroflexi bacterium]|nr:CoA transferase [Chloroflexota bacterium]